MVDFILEFIDFNSDVPRYDLILPSIFTYLLILWVIVSVWVYFDAKKRYSKTYMAVVIAILNLLLQFPFLFVYLLIRPHTEDDFDDWIDGGVNVPIVNFTGKDGVEMSFELRIHPKRMATSADSEMKIDVSFTGDNDQMKVVPVVSEKEVQHTTKKEKSGSFFSTVVSSVNGRIKAVGSSIKSKVGNLSEPVLDKPVNNNVAEESKDKTQESKEESAEKPESEINENSQLESEDQTNQDQFRSSKKKKKKKKHKK